MRPLTPGANFLGAGEPVREPATFLLYCHVWFDLLGSCLIQGVGYQVSGVWGLAERWTLEQWNERPFGHRFRDRASVLVKRQL